MLKGFFALALLALAAISVKGHGHHFHDAHDRPKPTLSHQESVAGRSALAHSSHCGALAAALWRNKNA